MHINSLILYATYTERTIARPKTIRIAVKALPFFTFKIGLSEGREWGVGSVVLDFCVFGAPRFSVHRSPNSYLKGFWGLWAENRGAPKTRKSTMTDPTPPFSAL